ncbi:MAG: hypothetical protein JOZ95_08835 [Solirubrobacterales bacterium]|nr:hypothetical protein [Solirubrobacterales bacterium]
MVSSVPWQEERMHIYDSTVRVPQLLARYAQGEALPHAVLDEARSALNAHDIGALGEPFVSADAALSRRSLRTWRPRRPGDRRYWY